MLILRVLHMQMLTCALQYNNLHNLDIIEAIVFTIFVIIKISTILILLKLYNIVRPIVFKADKLSKTGEF